MNDWLFLIIDSARDTTLVAGSGATVEDAEVDAVAKWHTEMSARDDYVDRTPVLFCSPQGATTFGDLPTLIL